MSTDLEVEAVPEPAAEERRTPSPAVAAGGRFGRAARRILLWAGLIFVGVFASLYALQGNIIFPGAATQGTPEAVVRPGPGEELLRLETDGGRVVALFSPARARNGKVLADAASRPALIFFYGNAMCLAYSTAELDRFSRLGLNVVIPDYLGYGMSGGKPSEAGCRQTAEACYRALRERGFPADRIVVGGWSLGGAVAIDLASTQDVAGLFAFSTFTSIPEMSRAILPVTPPAALFRDKFDSLSKMPKLTCPILLGHGRRDRIVPFKMFQRLYAAVEPPPAKLEIDADHNDFLGRGGAELDRAILVLVTKAAAGRR